MAPSGRSERAPRGLPLECGRASSDGWDPITASTATGLPDDL